MRWGYNTNGFAFHRLPDAVAILHELGYAAVGVTLDVHCLDPFAPDADDQARTLAADLGRRGMRCVVETGARFLLDPRRKHQPTLVSPTAAERERRTAFLVRSCELAAILGAEAVSFWAGTPTDVPTPSVWEARLLDALKPVLRAADEASVPLALEPEPGMAIATLAQGLAFVERIDSRWLGLTVDVGHLHCQREGEVPELLRQAGELVWNVHLEDMRRDVHDHLAFGEGEMAFGPLLAALREIGYDRGAYVELSRHAHDAVETARRALAFLRRFRTV